MKRRDNRVFVCLLLGTVACLLVGLMVFKARRSQGQAGLRIEAEDMARTDSTMVEGSLVRVWGDGRLGFPMRMTGLLSVSVWAREARVGFEGSILRLDWGRGTAGVEVNHGILAEYPMVLHNGNPDGVWSLGLQNPTPGRELHIDCVEIQRVEDKERRSLEALLKSFRPKAIKRPAAKMDTIREKPGPETGLAESVSLTEVRERLVRIGAEISDLVRDIDRMGPKRRGRRIRVTASAVNVRVGPGLSRGRLGIAYRGESFPAVGTDGVWVEILWSGDQKGWIDGRYGEMEK